MPYASTPELEKERRAKISAAMKGRMPKNLASIAGWNRGKPAPWARANAYKRLGLPTWNKGLKGVQKSPFKGKRRPEYAGEKHPNWRGGFNKKAYAKNYRIVNKERINYRNLQRAARKRNAEGSHTFLDWELLKAHAGYRCARCGEKKPLTQDHIVPLSKGGSDYIWNIQPLCKPCNSSKHDKRILFWVPITKLLTTRNHG